MFWDRKSDDVEIRVFEVREGRVSVVIDAAPEAVWDHLSDLSRYGEWVRFFKATPPAGQERLEKAGDYFEYETTVLGVKFRGRMVAVERVAPQRSAFVLVAAYRSGGEYLLEPYGSGTRLHYTIWGEIPSSFMGKAVDRVVLAGQVRDRMQEHVNRLKAHVEGVPFE